MAMTACETCVEDRVLEAAEERLGALTDKSIAALVRSKLDEEIDSKAISDRLDQYVKLRGNVVHRSRTIELGPPRAHPVTKEDLERAIRFLKNLVQATERACRRNRYRIAIVEYSSATGG